MFILVVMVYHLKVYGNYVYKKIKRQLFTYAFLDLTAQILNNIVRGGRYGDKYYIVLFWNILYIYNLPGLLLTVAVLKFKCKDDMIMELSKLDYLAIVSIF